MHTLIRMGLAALASAAVAAGAPATAQQNYPSQPIRMVVPFPPGGLTDNLGRAVSEVLARSLKQSVVVENRPGAGTLVGAAQVAKAPADGYTLLVATSTTLGVSPVLFKKTTAFKPDSLTGVAMLGNVTLVLVTRPEFPARSASELVSEVRAHPGTYTFASPGNGTAHHLMLEMLRSREKLDIRHIPYQGTPPAMTDVMAGRVDFMLLDASAAVPQIQSGALKALAVTGSRRLAVLPDVPAFTETYPYMDLQIWQSIAAPAGTPAAITTLLNDRINQALRSDAFRKQLARIGLEANPMDVDTLNAFVRRDIDRWTELVELSGSQVD